MLSDASPVATLAERLSTCHLSARELQQVANVLTTSSKVLSAIAKC